MTDNSAFAAQARNLCPESDEHHDRVWFCMTCYALRKRLEPISDVLRDVLHDAQLTLRLPDPLTADLLYCTSYAQRHPCDCDPAAYHRWNCASTPAFADTVRALDTNPWTVVTQSRAYCDLSFPPVGINSWDGLSGTHCGRGPCCLGDGHNGRCRM